jgi:hypothetical protein
MAEPVLEDVLGNWEELYKEFRKATPSSPVWYSLVDMAVGVLISERIDAIKKQIAARSPQGHGDAHD